MPKQSQRAANGDVCEVRKPLPLGFGTHETRASRTKRRCTPYFFDTARIDRPNCQLSGEYVHRPVRPRLPHLLRPLPSSRRVPHSGAPLHLARRRTNGLFAMLHDGAFYESRVPRATAA